MFLSFINSFSAPNIDSNGPDQWIRFDKNWGRKPIEDWLTYFFTDYIIQDDNYKGSKFDKQIQTWATNAIVFVEDFEKLLNLDVVSFEYLKPTSLIRINHDSYGLDLSLKIDISNIENRNLLYKALVVNYENIINPQHWRNDNRPFLSFSWRGLSTGEIAMLRLFSRFNNLRNIIKVRREVASPGYQTSQITNLVFLIDEGEIGLHPTWQKQFLSILIDNLPLMLQDEGIKSIQLILSTHSPFILSDVPNNHVIFLEKNEKGESIVNRNPLQDKKMTFGSNIHSLLSDGFFMKDGLIGDFAKKKINQVIDDLIETGNKLSVQRKVEIQSIIPLVGEPIIRKKILDLYNERINLTIDERIRALEESKNKLEKDIENLKSKQDDSNKKN
ncbi:AAA family ATPase [Emticicia fluvialis]|uniref:AAA family ATPase n=1 Tax=Emticicia fluvialis TaxID=2974474 RepID=UPI0021658717|nr:AAA family ATPase [Emticicia fluvialis]